MKIFELISDILLAQLKTNQALKRKKLNALLTSASNPEKFVENVANVNLNVFECPNTKMQHTMSDIVEFSKAVEQMILSQPEEGSIKFEVFTQEMTGVVKILIGQS